MGVVVTGAFMCWSVCEFHINWPSTAVRKPPAFSTSFAVNWCHVMVLRCSGQFMCFGETQCLTVTVVCSVRFVVAGVNANRCTVAIVKTLLQHVSVYVCNRQEVQVPKLKPTTGDTMTSQYMALDGSYNHKIKLNVTKNIGVH